MSVTTKTEFVSTQFETEVSEKDIASFAATLQRCVSELRDRIDVGDTVEGLLEGGAGDYQLRSSMSVEGQDTEPLTKQVFIDPIFDELGYDTLYTEISGVSDDRAKLADYSYPLKDNRVDSRQLLVEAEPLNKKLEGRGHGIDQVENWLSRREFESDFGFATDGKRWIFIRYDPDSYSHDRIEDIDLSDAAVELFHNHAGSRDAPIEALSDESVETIEAFLQTFERDNFVSIAADSRQVIREKQEEITDEFYDEYIRVVFGFRDENEERSPRSLVGDGVIAPEEATGEDTRLFAVKTMNRLIFIKFLEDKRLVQSDLLRDLKEMYDNGAYARSLYDSFIDPLFFEVMNHKPDSRPKHVGNVDAFDGVPYLNGGLFRPVLGDEDGLDEREFDVENSVLEEVIELLERYDFSADGGPTDLDPSVLGNVFEKTINYLTTNPGDQNKELGAYYTPKEITRFCAEETIRPALRECFEDWLIENSAWREADYDTVYELIDDVPEKKSFVKDMINDVVDELRVVDPAMGSGHFLTSVTEEIVTVRQTMHDRIGEDISRHQLKKQTVQKNLYGVDIVGPAVEIGKLRLWLSVIGEVTDEDAESLSVGELALPNIAFNLRQGNSLIGYTNFPEVTEEGDTTLHTYQEDTVRSRYEDIIEEIEAYELAGWEGKPEEAERHRRRAFKLLKESREDLVDDIHQEFREAGVGDITHDEVDEFDPFHWVLEFAEVYADGGFDVIVGNPPWDRLKPLRDDFFSRYDAEFRTRMPNDKDAKQEELLEDEEIDEAWEKYNENMERRMEYYSNSPAYELQSPTVAGKSTSTENDLSALFLERVFSLSRGDGYVAQVLPGAIFNGASAKDLRTQMLDETRMRRLAIFSNRGIFGNIDSRYVFGVTVFRNSGSTDVVSGGYRDGEIDLLENIDEKAVGITRQVLENYSPKARIFPYISKQEEVDVLEKVLDNPPISEEIDGKWHAEPYAELHRTNDTDRFVESEEDGDYPVLGGSNIYQYAYSPDYVENLDAPEFWSVDEDGNPEKSAKRRVREKNLRKLKRALYDAFDGTGSQKGFVNDLLEEHRGEPLSAKDVLLDCTEYRVTFRDVARSNDERTIIASVIPDGVVCHNTIHTVRPYEVDPDEENLSELPLHDVYDRVFSDKELFAALGLLNSIPFDFLMRTKIDTHIVMYKFKESQVPRLTEGEEYFEYIWKRAARLNCYGDEFEEMRERLDVEPATDEDERRELQAEIDAAAFHAYGLDKEETEFVLDDFHQVENPRVMDDAYFEMVKEKHAEIG
ncbi:hypothetical protein EGH25_00760 [Haladaptatus sp. F3-133]|uniref:site-specific DNA-methyltransferase (adenine-specific) n=1 Tax=Halorutilus salinus TaxID=2487751 RepID=A0A9Q4C1S5_9EURY|nr:DNA methyltransferase [Halorutilus salinus]MCX2817893.1 hypothetical protein [Halorutilus salinus]